MKIKKSTIFSFFIFIILNLLLFQPFIQEKIYFIKYLDELVAGMAFLYLIFSLKNNAITKSEAKILISLCLLLLIGTLGTVINRYQTQFNAIFIDVFNLSKFIIAILGLNRFFKIKNVANILNLQLNAQKIIIIITFIFMIINFLIGLEGMTYEIRYGIRAFQFIYGHAGALNVITTFQVCFLLYEMIKNKQKKHNYIYFFLCELILISTLRTRAFVFAVLAFIVYFYFVKKGNLSRKKFLYIIISIVAIFFIASSQLNKYFNDENRTPRNDLLNGSLVLMKDYFPIGTGFATYGSYAASKYYSPIYYTFGFQKYYGMSKSDNQFLTDNFWPMILGEFGILGFLIYIYMLYLCFKYLSRYCTNEEKKAILILIFITMIFNSTVSSAFVHYTSITYAFILTYLINVKQNKE